MSAKKKVLIVDDDRDILEALELIFDTEGYETKTSSGNDDIDGWVKEFQPDVVVLDVLLSGNDGRLICKRLKADLQTRNVPIIMISAHPDAKRSTREVGADGFLAKPFDINELLQKVESYLSAR